MKLRLVALAWAIVLAQLAGCATGRKPYPNESAVKNVSVRTAASSGSILSSMHVALDIYSVDPQCRPEYVGTVELDEASVAIGIPAGRWGYLVFDFDSSSFLGGTRGRMSHDLFFKPLADRRYEIEVTYQDEIYNVILSEQQARGALRELPRLGVDSCRAEQTGPRT